MIETKLYTYNLQCTRRGLTYFPEAKREGLLFIINDDKSFGVGEYAPMSGFHSMSILEMGERLKVFSSSGLRELFTLTYPKNKHKLSHFFSGLPSELAWILSMTHWHRSFSKPLAALPIKLSAMIEPASISDALASAQNLIAQGYSCLKIKIGSLEVKDEIKKINLIKALSGPSLAFRLDANGRLSFKEAKELIKGLKKTKIEYFEAPFNDMSYAPQFFKETGIPLAIDEVIDEGTLQTLDESIKFIVIKPSRFKSIYEAMEISELAKTFGKFAIWSHCFESGFSASIFALVLNDLGLHDHAHGIFAEGFFKEDLLREPLRSFRGQLRLDILNLKETPIAFEKVFLF